MSKPTLALKSTVTHRAPLAAELVDAAERIKQSEHHQAANAAATAAQTEPAVCKHRSDPHELQSEFLAENLGKQIIVFLANGVRLSGRLRRFDQFTVLLENAGEQQLIFKSAISTVIAAPR